MTPSRDVRIAVVVTALVVAGAALRIMQPALIPFVVAIFLSNIFRPLVLFLRKRHVPMGIALLLVLLLVGAVLLGLSLITISSVNSLIAALPRYEARWNQDILPGILKLLQDAPQALRDQLKDLEWSNIVQVSAIAGVVYTGAGSFVSLLSTMVLVLLFMLFILGGSGLFERKIRMAYSAERAAELTGIIGKVNRRTEHYLLIVTGMNAVSAIITTGILAIFGVDLALLWGLFTFLVNFIPTIGSIFSIVLPIAVAVLQFGGITRPLEVAGALIVIQFLWGSVITPRIMGSTLDLSPLLVLLSLIFWGWIWGPWGMILSVPITSMIKIVFESIDSLRPVALLMGSGEVIADTSDPSASHLDEAEKRLADYRAGAAATHSASDVIQEARRRIRR